MIRKPEPPRVGPPPIIQWENTEFGVRSTDHRYRIVYTRTGWRLLDEDWNPISEPDPSRTRLQSVADDLERQRLRNERLARESAIRAEQKTKNTGR